ncbi:MAG: 4-hydroxyphenylacetate 3-hydroxylase family protein [Immundisolibacter sp.]|uniref:4-hydroxyphenylacetate 3-hydroxylase family protein n=1 Tax=Immundisolibacter sp. TaxID=1934948 RepID=UPI003EE414E3
MGIRTGAQYIASLADDRALYIAGQRVRDVTRYAPLAGILGSVGEHYDSFHDPALQADYTFASPKDGKPVSNSFLAARTVDEVQQRVRGEAARKEATYGLMGRLPDFMNAFVTDAAVIAPHVLGHKDKAFADNAIRYWEYCRDEDICLTHTLADPKRDYSKDMSAQRTLRAVRETDAGIVVSGARMLSTLAAVSNELWVGPFMPRRPGEEEYALCFAVPVATPGLKFLGRESYARGGNRYDRPLAERFDEGDALAVFDNVLVPWERVFIYRDLVAYNMMAPSFPGYLLLQANLRGRAKLRFMTGLACKMADVLGRSELPHYQQLLGEFLALNEIADGLVEASASEVVVNAQEEFAKQADPNFVLEDVARETASLFASPNRGMVGISMLRFFLPEVNTKVNELIRLMGSSSLVMTVTEADFANPDTAADLETYMSGAGASARERVQVMKLAWDAVAGEFGGRQEIYEIFFAGDPFLSRQLHFHTPRRAQYQSQVDRLLRESDAG